MERVSHRGSSLLKKSLREQHLSIERDKILSAIVFVPMFNNLVIALYVTVNKIGTHHVFKSNPPYQSVTVCLKNYSKNISFFSPDGSYEAFFYINNPYLLNRICVPTYPMIARRNTTTHLLFLTKKKKICFFSVRLHKFTHRSVQESTSS